MQEHLIRRPDDWHVHFRDELFLKDTTEATAKHFARALIMPNLKAPLNNLTALEAYRQRILKLIPAQTNFTPYMTFYLNKGLSPLDLEQAQNIPYILGAKWYPQGVTTHSSEGVDSIKSLYPLLDLMQERNLVLQIHGEAPEADIFDRELCFLKESLPRILKDFPRLRIVLEHISTAAAVDFIKEGPERLGATITVHHLLYNRNDLLASGLKPHFYCLPLLKRQRDQKALQQAAFSGNPHFFAGTDSAPHSQTQKESACGCAGIYSAPFALALYASCFDAAGQMKRLNEFMSRFGASFYQLPLIQDELILIKKEQTVPMSLSFADQKVIPIAAGQRLPWSIHDPAAS